MTKKSKKNINVPNLRFKEFEDEWEEREIGELLTIGSGKDYKHLGNGDIPVFGTGGLMTHVDEFLYSGETVCIGRKGTIDKPMYFKGKIWTVDTLFYTHSFKRVLPSFVYDLFQKINWKQYSEASGVPSLSKSTIEQIQIHIPLEVEQIKIASFLEKIDERIATQSKIIDRLQTSMQSLREKILTQKLKFKDDKGNDFLDWHVKELGEICIIIMGQSPDSNAYNTVGNGIPLIQGNADIQNRISIPRNYTSKITKECFVGDLILTVRAPVGAIAKSVHNACIGRGVCAIRNLNDVTNIEFIYQFLVSYESQWTSLEQGSTFTSVSATDIKKIKIPYPTIKEQTYIANFLSTFEKKIETEKQILEQYQKQKNYLLQNMFI